MVPDRPDGTSAPLRRKLVEEETSGEIIGAFYTVYNSLGYGLSEIVYLRALEVNAAGMIRHIRVIRDEPVVSDR